MNVQRRRWGRRTRQARRRPEAEAAPTRGPARRPRRRIALIALVLLAAVALVLLLRPEPLEVEAAAVVRGPLQVTVDEEGRTRVRNRYVVSAPVDGQLRRIVLEEGDAVVRGDVVARIQPAPLEPRERETALARLDQAQAAVGAATAAVAEARAAAAQAGRDLSRAQRLLGAGAISRRELEEAELELETRTQERTAAEARLGEALAEVEAARAALIAPGPATTDAATATPVRSPVTGQVLRVLEKDQRVVPAGTELLELGDPNDLEVVVDVLSTDAVDIRPGDPMPINDWGGARILAARVRTVEPAAFEEVSALGVEEQRVNIIGEFLEPTGPLGDQYRVEARVIVWQAANVLKVPSSALFRHDGDWAVFVIDDGRARLREIDVGHRGAFEVEVRAGLREGELVILYPGDELEEGARVEPRERANGPGTRDPVV